MKYQEKSYHSRNTNRKPFGQERSYDKKDRKEAKNFNVVYGKHAVLHTLENPKRIIYNLYLQDDLRNEKIVLPDGINPIYKTKDEMFKLCKDGDKHQGYIAEVSDLICNMTLSDHLKRISKKENATIVLLDQLNDPHNLGAVLRSACCFGVDLVITTKFNMPSINSSVIRSSAGMSELIEILTITNLNETMKGLKDAGFCVIGMDGELKSRKLREVVQENKKIAFVLGSEGSGMRPSIRENCDEVVRIEMSELAESLNVSNAAAIVMYEVFTKLG